MKTVFQHYMDQKDLCERKGRKMKDRNLRTFYAKAAAGFELKARKLSLEEGSKPYKNFGAFLVSTDLQEFNYQSRIRVS